MPSPVQPRQPTQRKARAGLRVVFAVLPVLVLPLLLGLALAWLLTTQGGLDAAARIVGTASRGSVRIDAASGRLLGPLRVGGVSVTTRDFTLRADDIEVRWSPQALLAGTLQIDSLSVAKIHYAPIEGGEREPPPNELVAPLELRAPAIAIAAFEYGSLFAVREIDAGLTSDGRHHALELRKLSAAGARLSGDANVDGGAPISVAAHAELAAELAEKPIALTLAAKGPLAALEVAIEAGGSASGRAEALVTPFAEAPFTRAKIALDDFDPAAWAPGAPSARLQIRAELLPSAPSGAGVSGEVEVINKTPGTLDQKRLPIVEARSRVDWQEHVARLANLRLKLRQGGELAGSGKWQDEVLELALDGRAINAASLHSALVKTRLQGPLAARISANLQTVSVNFHDERFRLVAAAAHAQDVVTIERVELASGKARLAGKGRLALDRALAFSASGELADFDPARFAKVPAALLNARFSASGAMSPHLRVNLNFALGESRLAGEPLSGAGEIAVDWPQIPKAELLLEAGANRLRAHGSFGRGSGTLTLDLDAPKLAPYGVDGGVSGQIVLSGEPQAPRVSAQLKSERIAIGDLRLSGLALSLEAGAELAAPLAVDLSLARIDRPQQEALLQALHLRGEGTTREQRWQAQLTFADRRDLAFAATGGFDAPLLSATPLTWRGQLESLRLSARERALTQAGLVLLAPAPLALAADAWSLGPADFAGEGGEAHDWRANLSAAADRRALRATLNASGERIGRIEANASAAMQGAWSLDHNAPWQAGVKAKIPDLAWLAGLVDDRWQSGGRLEGELALAGTPARPVASGALRGDALVLRRPELGLALERGELALDLSSNRLRVRRLAFDSVLKPMPAPLRRVSGEAVRALAAKPGRLELSGELEFDREQGATNAFVDYELDRLGAWQLPEQWLLISGKGRLGWRAGALSASGAITADAGYWQLAPAGAPRLSDDVVVKRTGSDKKASALRPNLDLDVSASLGDSLYFNGAGLSSRLAGEIRLRAQGRDLPRATGTIATREGRYEAYGQQLSIERGVLTFQGLLDNPALDIRAVRTGLAVEAGVQVGGNAQRPVVKLFSDPDLPDAEKLSWLVLGHGSEQSGPGDAATLLAAATSVLGSDSGGLVGQIKKRFGVDELAVRQGQIGDSGRQATSRIATTSADTPSASGEQIFVAGKRIASNAVLSFEQAIGKAESVVKLTLSLSRQVSLIGRAGSDNAIDILYTITVGEKPRPAERK
jgi:translocation and assembly module TamB